MGFGTIRTGFGTMSVVIIALDADGASRPEVTNEQRDND
jgi:hypothetical protein